MATQAEKAERFLALHHTDGILVMPNAWDAGSAKVLASLGFEALATTSSGRAATYGKLDGCLDREQALDSDAKIVAATDLPISADLEDGFSEDPAGVAETIELARQIGLAGCSIEDYSGESLFERQLAAERVAAAAEAAKKGSVRLVLTARAENFIRGNPDLQDTVARLAAYEEAGADVLFAPGLKSADDIRQVVSAVSLPVNVLAVAGTPPVAELQAIGVKRLSVGGAFAFAALAAAAEAAEELRDRGTYSYLDRTMAGVRAVRGAF